MGAQMKTIGKVLIVMGILMFIVAPLFRDSSARGVLPQVDHAVGPSQRSFLYRMSHPVPDGATFCYACALVLEMVGAPLAFTAHLWRPKRREEPPLVKGSTVI